MDEIAGNKNEAPLDLLQEVRKLNKKINSIDDSILKSKAVKKTKNSILSEIKDLDTCIQEGNQRLAQLRNQNPAEIHLKPLNLGDS